MILSIVVPTRGRPELLARCLDRLVAQRFSFDQYEILIADDGAEEASALKTRAVVKEFSSRHPHLRYIAVRGRHGPAAARNRGWKAARGEVVAFTDDDTMPDPGWAAAGLRGLLGRETVVAVTGATTVPLPEEPTDYELNESGLERAEFITANCFCRRSALERIGGFDERFEMAWREDSDLHFRLLELGEIRKVHDALVVHPVRPAGWGVALKQAKKSLFNALLYKKHPQLYRERIQSRPPLRYYAMVAALVVALLATAFHFTLLALAAFFLWLGLVLDFAHFRLKRTRRTLSHVAEMIVTSALLAPIVVYWRIRGALKFRVVFL
jgi:GT2 family glycosyltransferase